jgi:hypothetical protein
LPGQHYTPKSSGKSIQSFPQAKQLTLQRGVTGPARMANISPIVECPHAARSYSFDYISKTKKENAIGLLRAYSGKSWLSYGVVDSS